MLNMEENPTKTSSETATVAKPPKEWPSYLKVKQPWEFKGTDALSLPPIPGVRRRMINLKYREKFGDGGWQLDDKKDRKIVGDLISAWMPEKLAIERNNKFRRKHTQMLKEQEEYRKEFNERMARESSQRKQWGGFDFN